MNPDLTMEQAYMLHKGALQVRDLSKEELIEALLDSLEDKFRQKQVFLAASRDAGFAFKFNEGTAILPLLEDEGEEVIGLPLGESEDDSLSEVIKSVNFELDMDSIVLGNDED